MDRCVHNGVCYGYVFDVEYLVSGLPGDEGKPGGDVEVKKKSMNPVEAMREE